MPRALFTGSTRARVRVCPPSAVLPAVRSTGPDKVGNVIHDHLALRVDHGIDAAVEAIPALCARWGLSDEEAGIARARCMSFEYTPPRGAIAEVALCLFDDGHVEQVRGARGEYDLPPGGIFALTIDLLWAEKAPLRWEGDRPVCPPGSVLWVADYKTGVETRVEPVEQNAQVLAACLLAARWTGAEMVAPAVILVRKGRGIWDVPESYLGPVQLKAIEDELLAELGRVVLAKKALDEGRPLEGFTTGAHCEFCPAESGCPAKTSRLLALLGESSERGDQPLTVDQFRRILPMVSQFEQAANAIKRAARAHVETTGQPIPLDDGKAWGPHPTKKKELVAAVALPILADQVGKELAGKAAKLTISREAVEKAFAASFPDALPDELKKMVRGFYAQAIAAGAQREASEIWWSAYRPSAPGKTSTGVDLEDEDGADLDDELRQPKTRKPRAKKGQLPLLGPSATSHAADRYQERINPAASPAEARATVEEAAARAVPDGEDGRATDPKTGLRLAIGPAIAGSGQRVLTVLGGPLRTPIAEVAGAAGIARAEAAAPPEIDWVAPAIPAASPQAAPAPGKAPSLKGLGQGAPIGAGRGK